MRKIWLIEAQVQMDNSLLDIRRYEMTNAERLLKRYRDAVGQHVETILPKNAADPLFPFWEKFVTEEESRMFTAGTHNGLRWPKFMVRQDNLENWFDQPLAGLTLLEAIILFAQSYKPDNPVVTQFLPKLQCLMAIILAISTTPRLALSENEVIALLKHTVPDSDEENPLALAINMEWDRIPGPFKQLVLDRLELWMRHYFVRSSETEPRLYMRHTYALRRYTGGQWRTEDKHARSISSWLIPLCQEILGHIEHSKLSRKQDKEAQKLARQMAEQEATESAKKLRRDQFDEVIRFWTEQHELGPELIFQNMSYSVANRLLDELVWAFDWLRSREVDTEQRARFKAINPEACLSKAKRLKGLIDVREAEAAARQRHEAWTRIQAETKKAPAEQKKEKKRQRQEKKARAEAERQALARRAMRKAMQEIIERRCRQIVKVFNGLFDCEIDPDAVLNGQVTGVYATIQSMPASTGMRLEQCLLLTQTLHQILEGRTWLELEEGDDEQEMRDAFESANILVWHELCHLVRPSAVDDLLKGVALPPDADEATQAQARELVLDALAMRLGQIAYVHPSLGEDFPRTEEQRLQLMRRSLSAMARRVVRHLGQADLQPGQREFILRLAAELQVHAADGSARAKDALEAMQETFAPLLEQGCELQEKYAALYGYVLAMAHVSSLPFRGSLDEDGQDGRGFGCAAPTIH